MTKHKVFVSYHHEKDQDFANLFRQHYGVAETIFLDRSLLKPLDSNNVEYIMDFIRQNGLKDSSVTVVLIGAETRFRKYVDWEIYSSLNQVPGRTRNGLLGILLPGMSVDHLPPRFKDHFRESSDRRQIGYAKLTKWSDIAPPSGWERFLGLTGPKARQERLQRLINAAYENRTSKASMVDLQKTPRFKANRPKK